ncbi:MAG: DUF3990 domain-containing protein [Eubacterium sp.]|nr:DUF3990 domain-containing protein [Eubacterium sp.]
MEIYHGSTEIVKYPEIRVTRYNKDFYYGFYCTLIKKQAERWATRFGDGYVNVYEYTENPSLKILKFEEITEEWLDFIAACRNGTSHSFDIVEGPMADDQIFNYVQDFIDGKISREQFWSLARFKKPTHQISFHTIEALKTLKFLREDKIYEE